MVFFNDEYKPKPDAEFQLMTDDVITIYLALQFMVEHPVWQIMCEQGMGDKIVEFLQPYKKMQLLFANEITKAGVDLPKPISDLFK